MNRLKKAEKLLRIAVILEKQSYYYDTAIRKHNEQLKEPLKHPFFDEQESLKSLVKKATVIENIKNAYDKLLKK